MEFSEDGSELTFTHQWARQSVRNDVRRGVRKLVTEETPWYLAKLLQGETLAYSRLPEELPDQRRPRRPTASRSASGPT